MTTNNASGDILAQLKRFEIRAEQSIAKLEAMQGEIDELLDIPDPMAVTVRLDAEGRVIELAIDDEQAQRQSVETLEHDINLAFVAANKDRPQRDPEQVRAQASSQGMNLTELVESVFASESQGFGATPSPIWNESRTVGVTLQGSTALRITCDHAWMRRSSTSVLAAGVADAVNDAIDAFYEGGSPHG